jgi:maltose O-acetyltransferase
MATGSSKTEYDKMVAGELYNANDPSLIPLRRKARNLCQQYNRSTEDDQELRSALKNTLFAHVGEESEIVPPFQCDYGSLISLGNRCSSISTASFSTRVP